MEQQWPEFKIVDIKALRERAGAFLSGVWNAGRHVELCLTEHPHKDVAGVVAYLQNRQGK